MEIIFKNGEKIILEWSPLVIEYLADYQGGIEQLKEDLEKKENLFKTYNYIIYCFVKAVYPTEIEYRTAISLIDPNDLEKIIIFACEKIDSVKFEKKDNKESTC